MTSSLIGPFIILQIATVIAIVMFLRLLLHKQLEIGLRRIKKIDKENLEKEVLLSEKQQRLDDEYEKRMQEAERQADILISTAKDDAKNMRDAERAKAKEEAKKIISGALEERDRVTRQTHSEVSKKAVDFSIKILNHVFSGKELQNIRTSGIKDTLEGLMSDDDVKKLFQKKETIEIITAEDLTAKGKEDILTFIGKCGGNKKDVNFTVKKDILGGIIVKIGESVINGALEDRIIKAAKEIKEEI